MKWKLRHLVFIGTAALARPALAQLAALPDFSFFEREARVVLTASRVPTSQVKSPATVHVITAEDIRASGAQTFWDLLRVAPGLDVVAFRTAHGEVGARGLVQPLNYRTLVLLDGKTVLNGFLDFADWETIPVTLEEVDRIEVLAGPASPVYGGNALSGVINIITKTPEQMDGGMVQYTGGERRFHRPSLAYGKQAGRLGYKASAAWKSVNRFGDASADAADVAKFNEAFSYDFSETSRLEVSGGIADHTVQLNNALAYDDGRTGYARADYTLGNTRARVFWNHGRTNFRGHPLDFVLDYDTYDASLEHSLELPARHTLVLGASYRRNESRSNVFAPGTRGQDLGAFFLEDVWTLSERWTTVLDGRLDKHPFTDFVFSPRGSLIFSPVPSQSIRLTAGTSFRNPTLLENYFDIVVFTPVSTPPYTGVETTIRPNTALDPERMRYQELAYQAVAGRTQAHAAVFHYLLSDIVSGVTVVNSAAPPVLRQEAKVVNRGRTEAWGGEVGGRAILTASLTGFAGYAYQSLRDEFASQNMARVAPRHKFNAGISHRRKGLRTALWAHWADKTRWALNPSAAPIVYQQVDAYWLLNGSAGYAFRRVPGLEVAVNAFNLANNKHHEAPPQSPYNGERIKSRWTGTLSYRF